jgi:DNA-binding NarL/FixJ family response regulator
MPVLAKPSYPRTVATRTPRARAPRVGAPAEPEQSPLGKNGKNGKNGKEIGSTLFITERTARTYVSNILGKLGLASRTQAALVRGRTQVGRRPEGLTDRALA